MYIFSSHLIVLFIYIYITWFYVDFNIIIKLSHTHFIRINKRIQKIC